MTTTIMVCSPCPILIPFHIRASCIGHAGATNGQLSPQGAALPTTPQQTRQSLTSPSPKRKRANDENLDSSLPVLKKSKYTARRSPEDKLEVVFKALQDVNWTLGDFLYHLFRQQDEKGNLVRRSQKHASYVHKLLSGRCGTSGKGVRFILNAWFQSGEEEDAEQLMHFTTSVLYQNIRSARPALTSFAAQLVKKKLVQEAEAAVQPRSGLHAMQQVSWADIHSTTVASVAGVIQKLQRLTWELVTEICARPPRKRGGVVVERQRRPVNGVGPLDRELDKLLDIKLTCNFAGNSQHNFPDGLLTK